jgi:hypothetical protein
VGAQPHHRTDLGVVQADLLDQLASQRDGQGLAGLDAATRQRPPDVTAGEDEADEQDAVGRVQQQGARRRPDAQTRGGISRSVDR